MYKTLDELPSQVNVKKGQLLTANPDVFPKDRDYIFGGYEGIVLGYHFAKNTIIATTLEGPKSFTRADWSPEGLIEELNERVWIVSDPQPDPVSYIGMKLGFEPKLVHKIYASLLKQPKKKD